MVRCLGGIRQSPAFICGKLFERPLRTAENGGQKERVLISGFLGGIHFYNVEQMRLLRKNSSPR